MRATARVAAAAVLGLGLAVSGGIVVAPATAQDGPPVGGGRLGEPGLVLDLPAGVPVPPVLPATCYLLADLDTGNVVLAQCAHSRGLPASTIKALTALTLVPRLDRTRVVLATDEDVAVDGTKIGLQPGYGYTVDQLFGAMLIGSANDAATALARANGGMATTAAQMNEVAARLGARDTVAANTSGLDGPGQLTSAYDLALIGRAALADPVIAGYVRTLRRDFPGHRIRGKPGARATYEVANHNALLSTYPGAIGVKNGYTNAAGHTLIGAARRGNRGYLLSYLGMPKRDWRTPASLLDWAFRYGSQARPVGRLVTPGSVDSAPTVVAAPLPPAAQPPTLVSGAAPHSDPATPAATSEPVPETAAARWALGGFVVVALGLAVWRRRVLRGYRRGGRITPGRSPRSG